MSYDKPSSSAHWHNSLARPSVKKDTADPGSTAHNAWGQLPRVSGNRSSLSPLATSNLPTIAGTTDAQRHQPRGDSDSHASPSIANFPPLSAASATRLNSSRRPTPPTPSQTHSPIHSLQAGAIHPSSSFAGRSLTSPLSRTISPQQSAGGAFYAHQGPGAAGGGGGFSAGTRSGTYSPALSGAGIHSPTGYKFERSSSVSSNPSSAVSGQSSLSKISATQVVLLVDTITEKKGPAEWETKADKIRKVCPPSDYFLILTVARSCLNQTAWRSLPSSSAERCHKMRLRSSKAANPNMEASSCYSKRWTRSQPIRSKPRKLPTR